MKEFFKRMKMDAIVSALVCIAFGVVLILYPVQTTTAACRIVGAVIGVLGIVKIISYIMKSSEKNALHLTLGIILSVVGLWILLNPTSIQTLIFIGIGVVLFVHGLEDFAYALETKRGGYDTWWLIFVMAVFCMVLGVVCIVDSFGVISVALTFVGIALIYDGISDLWIVSRVNHVAKEVRRAAMAVEAESEIIEDTVEDKVE